MDARKKLLKKLQDNPKWCKLKEAKELKNDVDQALSTCETAGRQWEEDLVFIEKDVYLAENEGKGLVEGKDYKFKWENIHGKWIEGVFIRQAKAGHHKLKLYEGKRVAWVS